MVPMNLFIFCLIIMQLTCVILLSFVAENWKSGWLGQFMWGVFSERLGLTSNDIVAMTTLNFTGATSPKNATSVYSGGSSYTRCVWEVKIGNAVREEIEWPELHPDSNPPPGTGLVRCGLLGNRAAEGYLDIYISRQG
jgi:hypothetical protein